MMPDRKRVGVAGCGLMGAGIAETAARAGFEVIVRELDDGALEAGRNRIRRSLERGVAGGKLTEEEASRALASIRFTTELEALAGNDWILEAVVERLDVKRALFAELDRLASPETIFATNTSSLPVTEVAAGTERPDRVVGLHFFNPVPVMRLVEVVRTLATSEETVARAFAFAEALGKETILSKDRSGFVVNLLLVPFMLDCIRQLERGVASIAEIDRGMVLGCGHPMGPLALCDFVGNDTTLRIAEIMHAEYAEARYAPPPLLRRMVAMGRFGRKSGKGFYDYTQGEPVPLPSG